MIDAVISRLKVQVPDLANRVEGAAEFATLRQKKRLPQITPAAHVLPLGFTGGRADAAAGAFTQMIEEVIGVVISVRSATATGARDLPAINALIKAIVAAIAGWSVADEVGVFRVLRGQLIGIEDGTIIYQIDFAISDQLRIYP